MVDRGVFFKVFETKCPSAHKRDAEWSRAAAYISKFSRPSAQVHNRKASAPDDDERNIVLFVGERDHRGVFILV